MRFVFHLVFILVCFSQIGVANGLLEGLLAGLGPLLGGVLKVVLGLLSSLLGGLGGNGGNICNGGTCVPDVDPLIPLKNMFVSVIGECLAGNDHKDKVVTFIKMSLDGAKLENMLSTSTDKDETLERRNKQIEASAKFAFQGTTFEDQAMIFVKCMTFDFELNNYIDIFSGIADKDAYDKIDDCLYETDAHNSKEVEDTVNTLIDCLPGKAAGLRLISQALHIAK